MYRFFLKIITLLQSLNPLDPIEISENPSEISTSDQMRVNLVLFTIIYLILNIYHCKLHLFESTLNCLQNGIGHARVSYILITDLSFLYMYLFYKDRTYSMGSAGINSELEIKLDKCPISTVAVKFPIFARICHTIYKHIIFIGSSKFIFHQIHAMEFTNCLSAFAQRRHGTREATTMTTEQLFIRKFLKKRQCNYYVN